MIPHIPLALVASTSFLSFTSASPAPSPEEKQGKDIVDTAVAAGSFQTLAAALKAGGLIDALKSKGPFTVFAPTDEAFARLPKGTVESLLLPENREKLVSILKYHVVSGKITSAQVVKLDSAETLAGLKVTIDAARGVKINDASVVKADVAATNGVIHVIDRVLLPRDIVETAVAAGSFQTLAAALKAGGLIDALKAKGPFTVFAPTDEAFARLPKGTIESLLLPENREKLVSILKYHVVSGKVTSDQVVKLSSADTLAGRKLAITTVAGVKVNDATVVTADVAATNGVIHVVDRVLLPN
jgi:uncharacterized surface protein with fasciclin (FAS1) repeats